MKPRHNLTNHFGAAVADGSGFAKMSAPFTWMNLPSLSRTGHSSPPDPTTLPRTALPSLSRITSGCWLNHGLLVDVQAIGMNFLPPQISQACFPCPLQAWHSTLVVPPQTLQAPIFTA